LAKQAGVEVTSLMVSDLGFDPYSSVLVTTGDVVRDQPELVRKMVAASVRGWRSYLGKPQATNEYILKLNPEGISAEALSFGVEILRGMCLPEGMTEQQLGMMTAERWERLVKQMLEIDSELRADRVRAAECYRLEFLP
jgi:NitT/TauT family transport system substrate-binding protein